MKRRRTDVRLTPSAKAAGVEKPDARTMNSTDDEIAMPARFGANAGHEA